LGSYPSSSAPKTYVNTFQKLDKFLSSGNNVERHLYVWIRIFGTPDERRSQKVMWPRSLSSVQFLDCILQTNLLKLYYEDEFEEI
jgi:hypothetical protein